MFIEATIDKIMIIRGLTMIVRGFPTFWCDWQVLPSAYLTFLSTLQRPPMLNYWQINYILQKQHNYQIMIVRGLTMTISGSPTF
jgi:hypothetical protein